MFFQLLYPLPAEYAMLQCCHLGGGILLAGMIPSVQGQHQQCVPHNRSPASRSADQTAEEGWRPLSSAVFCPWGHALPLLQNCWYCFLWWGNCLYNWGPNTLFWRTVGPSTWGTFHTCNWLKKEKIIQTVKLNHFITLGVGCYLIRISQFLSYG